MRTDHDPKPDVLTQAAIDLAETSDSTHASAPSASAARMIRVFHANYPEIKTHLLTDHVEIAYSLTEAMRLEFQGKPTPQTETKGTPTKEDELKKTIQNTIRAQIYLIKYLERVIQEKELPPVSPRYADHPDIQHTLELIKRIHMNQELTAEKKLVLPPEKKLLVFKQMLSMAKICPGIQLTELTEADRDNWAKYNEWWNLNHAQWSENPVFDPNTKKLEKVTASIAETLNLTSRALLDSTKFLASPPKDTEAQISLEEQQEKDINHRIHSFCQTCIDLQKQVEAGNFEKCSTGRQHDLIFLFDKSFLINPTTTIELARSRSTLVYEKMNVFIEMEMRKITDEKRLFKLFIDWIEKKLPKEDEVPVVIEFLREQFSQKPGFEEKTNDIDPDQGWKAAFINFLEEECLRYGIDPNVKGAKELAIKDYVEYVESLPFPITLNSVMPLYQSLIKTEDLPVAPKATTPELRHLIELRNKALEIFKHEMRHKDWSKSFELPIKRLYDALKLADNLYHYRNLTVFSQEEKDEKSFGDVSKELQSTLTEFFENYDLNKNPPDNFAKVQENYVAIEKTFNKKTNKESIEHIFGKFKAAEEKFDVEYEKLHVLNLEEKTVNPQIFLTDGTLEKWHRQYVSFTQMEIDLSSYEINRILLHGLTVPFLEWSPAFCHAIRLVTQWVTHSYASDPPDLASLKKSYHGTLLNNLAFMLFIKEHIGISDNTKLQYSALLGTKGAHKIIYENQIPNLFGLAEDKFSIDERLQLIESIPSDYLDFNQRQRFDGVAGATMLWQAASKGHLEIVEALFDPERHRGIQVDLGLHNGCTPLMIAAEKGHLEVVRFLLSKGANPNAKTSDGMWTPLFTAADKGYVEIVKLLLERDNLDPVQHVRPNGDTPIHLAKKHPSVIQAFKESDFVYRENADHETLLSSLFKDFNRHRDQIIFLLKHAKTQDPRFQKNVFELFFKFSLYLHDRQLPKLPDISELTNSLETDPSTKCQMGYLVGSMLIHMFSGLELYSDLDKMISQVNKLLKKEQVLDPELALAVYDIGIRLSLGVKGEKGRDKEIKLHRIISIFDIAAQMIPDNHPATEMVLKNLITYRRRLPENLTHLNKEIERISKILDSEEKKGEISRYCPQSSFYWFNEVIKSLTNRENDIAAEFSIVLIRYVLAFTPAPGETDEEINLINNLNYILLIKYLELGKFENVLSLLEKVDKLENNLLDPTALPLIHTLITQAERNQDQLENYYNILEFILEKFPTEPQKFHSHNQNARDKLRNSSESVNNCFLPLFTTPEDRAQQALRSTILEVIINNTHLQSLLEGRSQFPQQTCFKGTEEVDIAAELKNQIQTLKEYVHPTTGSAKTKVSMEFMNNKFLPFIFNYNRVAKAVLNGGIPVVTISDDSNRSLIIAKVNEIIKFIADYTGQEAAYLSAIPNKEFGLAREAKSPSVTPVSVFNKASPPPPPPLPGTSKTPGKNSNP